MALIAAMPEAKINVFPPSRISIASSSALQVSFPYRAYPIGPPAWNVEFKAIGGLSSPSAFFSGRPAATTLDSVDNLFHSCA